MTSSDLDDTSVRTLPVAQHAAPTFASFNELGLDQGREHVQRTFLLTLTQLSVDFVCNMESDMTVTRVLSDPGHSWHAPATSDTNADNVDTAWPYPLGNPPGMRADNQAYTGSSAAVYQGDATMAMSLAQSDGGGRGGHAPHDSAVIKHTRRLLTLKLSESACTFSFYMGEDGADLTSGIHITLTPRPAHMSDVAPASIHTDTVFTRAKSGASDSHESYFSPSRDSEEQPSSKHSSIFLDLPPQFLLHQESSAPPRYGRYSECQSMPVHDYTQYHSQTIPISAVCAHK
jgi:hypothetical protein